jgi:glycosyltransferase involved in cell wall biosynthesis
MQTISVVVPVLNEEESVKTLFNETKAVLKKLKAKYEIIFVDDGSTDKTYVELLKLKPITVVRMRKNYGQASALDAGIKQAKGDLIVTLDGDGQNDPKDIPALIGQLNKGYDAVCGWRYKRKDGFSKRYISMGAACLRRFLVNDGVKDSGCTLRVYKKECFDELDLYGEMHRMIPALLKWRGFVIGEIKVSHRSRLGGVSKYSWDRTIKGFLDMLYVWFWRKYSTRPQHLFGGLGLLLVVIGSVMGVALAYLRLFQGYLLSNRIWPMVSFFMVMIGVQLVVTGLLAASVVESSGRKKYFVKEVKNIRIS